MNNGMSHFQRSYSLVKKRDLHIPTIQWDKSQSEERCKCQVNTRMKPFDTIAQRTLHRGAWHLIRVLKDTQEFSCRYHHQGYACLCNQTPNYYEDTLPLELAWTLQQIIIPFSHHGSEYYYQKHFYQSLFPGLFSSAGENISPPFQKPPQMYFRKG